MTLKKIIRKLKLKFYDANQNIPKIIGQYNNRFKVTKWIDENGKKCLFKHKKHSSGPFGDDLGKDNWLTYEEAIEKYKKIFLLYKLFGDNGIFSPKKIKYSFLRRVYIFILSILKLSDWYDTHATR